MRVYGDGLGEKLEEEQGWWDGDGGGCVMIPEFLMFL